ncbi:MAG TPA: hypothetical protein VJL37_12195 [Flavobacterium sp.]|nr:hypothetical protein [Flavobacterium sp.]
MKTVVLSLSFFVLAVSPYTCSSELSELEGRKGYPIPNSNATEHSQHFQTVDIDPIVMPKKP